MDIYIITGASRGLGEAFVRTLIGQEMPKHIIGVSRQKNLSLMELSQGTSTKITWLECDLNHVDNLDTCINDILGIVEDEKMKKALYVIHNAGVVGPIAPIHRCSQEDIQRSFNVNTIAPIMMTGRMIEAWQELAIPKRIMAISSGAADSPYDGWSCYCSTKAALNMFTQCVALEQASHENPVQIMGFAPGIVDTDMQGDIRKSDKEDFSNVERFVAFKENEQLRQPMDVAIKALEILWQEVFPTGQNLHI